MLEVIYEQMLSGEAPMLVVLDDDLTGTQTCHDLSVITVWGHTTLCIELSTAEKSLFILKNSRALLPEEAKTLITEICQNIAKAANETGKEFEIVLRGDSTLRRHFSLEPETVEEVLGKVDAWILAPFFYHGGRYTINDVHYVVEGDMLVLDRLCRRCYIWVQVFEFEGLCSRKSPAEVLKKRPLLNQFGRYSHKVTEKLLDAPEDGVIIINAAAESDMLVFAAGPVAGR